MRTLSALSSFIVLPLMFIGGEWFISTENAHGRFGDFVNVVFSKQDSLGLKSWTSYATEAGLDDLDTFQQCIEETGPLTRVESGLGLRSVIEIVPTPTVLINQWKLDRPPFERSSEVIDDILAERNLFASK